MSYDKFKWPSCIIKGSGKLSKLSTHLKTKVAPMTSYRSHYLWISYNQKDSIAVPLFTIFYGFKCRNFFTHVTHTVVSAARCMFEVLGVLDSTDTKLTVRLFFFWMKKTKLAPVLCLTSANFERRSYFVCRRRPAKPHLLHAHTCLQVVCRGQKKDESFLQLFKWLLWQHFGC